MGQQVWDEWEGSSPWLTSDEKNHQKAEQRKLRMAEIGKKEGLQARMPSCMREILSFDLTFSWIRNQVSVFFFFRPAGSTFRLPGEQQPPWLLKTPVLVLVWLPSHLWAVNVFLWLLLTGPLPFTALSLSTQKDSWEFFLGVSVLVEKLKLFFLTLFCSRLCPMHRESAFVQFQLSFY